MSDNEVSRSNGHASSTVAPKRSRAVVPPWLRQLRTLRAILTLTLMVVAVVGFNVAQLLSLIVLPFSRKHVMLFNGRIAGLTWYTMQWYFERIAKGKVTFSGDRLPEKENAICFSNHVGWTDFYLLHSLATRKKMQSSCKYFCKDSLKWLPGFGWGMWLMGMIFLKRDWTSDKNKIEDIFRALKTTRIPVWIVSYLEGTRITKQKLAESQAFAKERGLPVLKNVLIPRTKGFIATVNSFRNTQVRAIYDFTIAYYDNDRGFQTPPSIVRVHETTVNNDFKYHVHVRRYLIEDLPSDDEELHKWVMERYIEKDAFLEELKERWTEGKTLLVEESPFW
ncbi:hypothetical protein HK097_001123 [Rhizophlyctis rosea]|uniref:Phospholipid/glycerol acyltransferase domain-containing protein n=1 Tax=Rhizophlyctis rosea TaxID=64517 RepID=A0AAD5SCR3_9FUNG|nr:hypothetical protein HK097_001123 [Rhizophlyctis rosea]